MNRKAKISAWSVFVCIFGLELAFGVYFTLFQDHYVPDALSRVSNAFYVLFSREASLAAIGFIWNPLPSLLTIPLVSVWPLFPDWVAKGMPGAMLTSLFAAATAAMLFSHLIKRQFAWGAALLFSLAYAFHPYIFLYGSNGMSETLFVFFLVICTMYITNWLDTGGAWNIIVVSISLALAFLTRYEAVPFGAVLAFGVVLVMLADRKKKLPAKWTKIESVLIILLFPAVLSGAVWIFLNYMIVGDPLYFLRSNYSNMAQVDTTITSVFVQMIGDPVQSLTFMMERMAVFMPPFLLIVLMRIYRKALFKIDFLILTLLAFSIPLLQYVMLLKGATYGWLRYFYYPLAIAAAWFPYEIRHAAASVKNKMTAVMAVVIAASGLWSVGVMNDARLAPDEYTYFRFQDSELYAESLVSRQVAQYLNAEMAERDDMLVLMDSFRAYNLIMYVRHPRRLAISSDLDFKEMLEDPPAAETLTHILVPKPEGVAQLDMVNVQYPDLYREGAPWAVLEKDFDDKWRLYRISHEIDPLASDDALSG